MKHASLAERKLGFQIHAVVFVLTLAVLVVVNLLTGRPYWVLWVAPSWGVGLLMHGWFGLKPTTGTGSRDQP
ncbi:conserved hypothetical protein [uncultured Pleomorphomonas sp.]|uniref:2TM domain-containing protein n=1 Tax=uncultured Pleomorphomonas sp. TaxID=442121 RepID=A0A212LCS5_9HYPH|nr:2TM domain-containing protein [uncultured Pleomorphomonas sp.]SCM75310.1 conserved hypothetical protein [uncultured Pleomorphomonas sp.]